MSRGDGGGKSIGGPADAEQRPDGDGKKKEMTPPADQAVVAIHRAGDQHEHGRQAREQVKDQACCGSGSDGGGLAAGGGLPGIAQHIGCGQSRDHDDQRQHKSKVRDRPGRRTEKQWAGHAGSISFSNQGTSGHYWIVCYVEGESAAGAVRGARRRRGLTSSERKSTGRTALTWGSRMAATLVDAVIR